MYEFSYIYLVSVLCQCNNLALILAETCPEFLDSFQVCRPCMGPHMQPGICIILSLSYHELTIIKFPTLLLLLFIIIIIMSIAAIILSSHGHPSCQDCPTPTLPRLPYSHSVDYRTPNLPVCF